VSVTIEIPQTGGRRVSPQDHPYTSDFSGLINRVREAGLLARQRGYYGWLIVGLSLALIATVGAMIWVGASWWQVALSPVLAVILTQFAFLGHELAHRQVFEKGSNNDRVGRILANLVVGISYSWWMNKHSRHHANPNTIGKDPDIDSDVIVFQPNQARRTRGLQRFIAKRQGWLFFPLLTLEGLNLHIQGFKKAFAPQPFKGRATELMMLIARHGALFALVFLVMPWSIALVFLATQLAVFGVYMGLSFAPNHKGMPQIERGVKVDFLRRQVLTSRNIRGGPLMDALMGGLNYQVEHHLFPNMPRPSLSKASRMVREYCQEHSISYTETSLWRSYAAVVDYLNRVGLHARDPFDCPKAQFVTP
jgi:fatty acid desaturase